MATFELIMPKMGESITEATILKWLKKEGDNVLLDEAVLEIATDKVDSEVPSPIAGVVKKVLYNEGDVVAVGKPVAVLETEAGEVQHSSPKVQQSKPEPQVVKSEIRNQKIETVSAPVNISSDRFYSPLVLNIARQEGISMAELERLPGTGAEGRVTKKDILAYVQNRSQEIKQPVQEVKSAIFSASLPLVAEYTQKLSFSKLYLRKFKMSGSSSTIKTFEFPSNTPSCNSKVSVLYSVE